MRAKENDFPKNSLIIAVMVILIIYCLLTSTALAILGKDIPEMLVVIATTAVTTLARILYPTFLQRRQHAKGN